MRAMAQAHPPALGLCDTRGCLPLHFACAGGASCAVIALLLRLYPESAGQADEQGFVALHYLAMSFGSSAYLLDEAVARQASVTDSLQSLRLLIQADQSMVTKNSPLGLPLDCLAKVLVPFPNPHTLSFSHTNTLSPGASTRLAHLRSPAFILANAPTDAMLQRKGTQCHGDTAARWHVALMHMRLNYSAASRTSCGRGSICNTVTA